MGWPVALAAHREATRVTPAVLPWPDLVALLTVPHVHPGAGAREDKDTLPAWLPVTPRASDAGYKRGVAHVESVSCLVLDLDSGEPLGRALTLARGHVALYHTSWSHSPEHPKGRLVFPLAAPAPAERWPEVWAAGARWAASGGLTVDAKAKDASRIYFVPAVPQDSPERRRAFRGGWQPGAWLCWRALLAAYPANAAPRAPYVAPPRRSAPAGDERAYRQRFGAALLATRCAELASTPEGGRNTRLFRAAAACAMLEAAGVLDLGPARRELEQAATAAGLGWGEIQTTINSGISRGILDGPWKF
jgi:hypothetical protein